MAGTCSRIYMGFFGGNLKDVLLGRPKNKWEVDMKIVLKETGQEGVNWIRPAQVTDSCRAFMKTAVNLQVP